MNLVTNGLALDVARSVGLHLLRSFALGFLAQTVFLFAALWIMIKVQKLNCNPFALLGSAALACALDYVPVVGIGLSVVALLLCITKAIGARTFTDAIFTAGVSYALTFCFNLFVLSALLGNLRTSVQVRARTAQPVTFDAPVATNTGGHTNSMTVAAPMEAPVASPVSDAVPAVFVLHSQPAVAPIVNTNSPFAGKMASEVATHFTIKGISKGAVENMAIIGNGSRTYDVVPGDSFKMQTASGKANTVCDSVDENKVILEVEGVKVTIQHKQSSE